MARAVRARRCERDDPSSAGAVLWAIATTAAAVIVGVAGTVFAWGIAGIFQTVTG